MWGLIFLKAKENQIKSAYSRVQTKPVKHYGEDKVVLLSDNCLQVLKKKTKVFKKKKKHGLYNINCQIEVRNIYKIGLL